MNGANALQSKSSMFQVSDVELALRTIEEQARRVDELKKELHDLRTYCTLTFGESHPEIRKCPHEMILEAQSSLMEKMLEFTEHDKDCLCAQSHQGRPTADGGYETLYGYGKEERWYQRDEKPECSCGLSKLLAKLSKKGKV